MACEQYQSWVTDAALGNLGVEQGKEWRFHVESCGACHAALAQEQFLLAAIERGIEAKFSSSDPSPAFLARVRSSLAENSPELKFGHWLRHWNLAALGAFALIALTIWIAHRPGTRERPLAQTQRKELVSPSPVAGGKITSDQTAAAQSPSSRESRRHPTLVKARRSNGELEPRVMVPMDEEAGLAHLYYSLQRRPVLSSAALPDSDQSLKLLSISPLEVPPLEASESEDSAHLPDAGRSR